MQDFLTFRRMITPLIIQIFFWIGVAGLIVLGLLRLAMGGGPWVIVEGTVLVVLGPIFWRVCCELLITFFRIEENTRP